MKHTLLKLTLILTLTGTTAAAGENTSGNWDENTGKGSVNGRDFPIAVVRNPGSDEQFLSTLTNRFGKTYQITRLPGGALGFGSQFLVRPFTEKDLLALPVRKDSAAMELFVLEHSMTFSLLDISGERLAVGTPLSVFLKAVPEPVPADSEFGYLKNSIKDAVRITFDFGNTTVSSLAGTLTVPAQDAKVTLRSAFEKAGLLPAVPGQELPADQQHEFFSDGKSQAGNFLLSTKPQSNEVQVNVNQVKVR